MSGERILVTGATGFVGAPLAARLAGAGAEVHAVSRRPPEPGKRSGAIAWHALDLEDAEATRALLGELRPARVYHLASLVTGRRDLDLVLPTFRANLGSTVHLLAAAAEHGVARLVLAGSMEEPAAGEAAGSPYAAAKAAASLYARHFHALHGLPVVTARIFMVYGPGQGDRSKVVPASIAAALAGRRPGISSGARPVDWIYVDDVVEGLDRLGAASGVEGATIDLGSGELVTVRAVVEWICRLTGVDGPEVGAVADRALERSPRADRDATRAAIGWEPRVGLEAGLKRTIEWLRAEGAASSSDVRGG